MVRQRNNITEGPIFSELNTDNIVPSTNAGGLLHVPKYRLYNNISHLTSVFEVIEKGISHWKSWFDKFGRENDREFMVRWLGPKKDVAVRLDNAKFEVQKQIGYF